MLMDRLNELMDGSSLPENELESMYVSVYSKALRGKTLAVVLITLTETIGTAFTHDQLEHILYAYTIGQKLYFDNISENIELENDNNNLH